MLSFTSERASEWYIPFVNTKMNRKITKHSFRYS